MVLAIIGLICFSEVNAEWGKWEEGYCDNIISKEVWTNYVGG